MKGVMEPEDAEQPSAKLTARLLTEPIRSLQLGPPVTVPVEATLAETVALMQDRHLGCVLVVGADGRLEGIFTERDLLARVAGRKLDWTAHAVRDYMTAAPEALQPQDGIAWALNLMAIGGYRHVPLTDPDGRPLGVVSVKDIVAFIVDLFPDEVLNLPPSPRQKPSSDLGGGED
jgi:CBS domain-containing protein